jgi:hypothetical protein
VDLYEDIRESHDTATNSDICVVSWTFSNFHFSQSWLCSHEAAQMLNSWPCCGHLEAYFYKVFEVFVTLVRKVKTNTDFVAWRF